MKLLLLILVLLICCTQEAYATRTVTSPWVDEGILKLKSKTGITHDDESESRDGAVQQNFSAEYGLTERFSVETELYTENPGNEKGTDITAAALKGKLQFTRKGENWIDPGARFSYEQGFHDNSNELELKIILGKDLEHSRHIVNFIFTHQTGKDAEDETEAGYSWTSRYKLDTAFEPGIEIYGNMGPVSDRPDYEDQDHSIGPAAYGKISDNLKYEAAYLVGVSENAADGRFKAALEYAVKF